MDWHKFSELKMHYPFVDHWGAYNKKRLKYHERKNRIYMRGIKIGSKKLGKTNDMGMFESGARNAQEITEEEMKKKTAEDVAAKL